MSPEPEINITHNTCTLWHLLLFAIRFSVKIGKAISLQRMAKPVANASLRHLPFRFSKMAKPSLRLSAEKKTLAIVKSRNLRL